MRSMKISRETTKAAEGLLGAEDFIHTERGKGSALAMSARGGLLVWAYAQAYVFALTCVYLSCYLRVTEAQNGETTSFNCNDITVKNQTHHIRRLKIASLNAEWLFDGRDDPSYSPWHPGKTSCPGMKHCGTEEGAQEHITKVSEYVKLVNADILNLVEVEDCDILREVIKRSSISDYQPLLKKGIDTATKQNVAMLTKYEPTEALYRLEAKESYPIEGSACGYTKEGKRTTLSKNYVAHFRVNDMVIAVHSLHLKAYPKVSFPSHLDTSESDHPELTTQFSFLFAPLPLSRTPTAAPRERAKPRSRGRPSGTP